MSQKRPNFHFSFIFVNYLAGAGHVPTLLGVDELLPQQLFGCSCPCLLRGRLCDIWNGKYTFLATYENREICRCFPRKSLRCKYARLASDGWDVTEREGTGRDWMEIGKGRDVMERERTGRRGTGRGGEGRYRIERDGTGRDGRDGMERDRKG